ncbi:hypothetical protein PLEOSDRAFT_1102823 [Pleurotus ostreatus PC15]|uniref:JmjC domain-containing protein n=1 Tax=Pleurotus ostreatus (strain PC15) TaxID=1137138 RepID=A0A067NXD3_PLEO1|nr:hypothetical protein PLEOSDRAFT_1102823 [Pleurotus ostreatus PC15]
MELDIVISSRPPKSRDDATEVSNVEPLIQEALDPESRATPVLREECSYAQFDSFWSLALPIVVRSYAKLHGPWSLPGLASVLGEDACEVLDCENPQYAKTTTVDLFLKELANPSHLALGAPVLKLKDYPKRATSERGASILSRDLQSCLPVPKYTGEDGPLNVTTLYSSNYQHTPYFGPVYNAGMISRQDESSHGNTRLRMEIFDTVYIMPTPGKARWLIFPSEYTEKLIDFICDRLQPNLDNPEVTPSLNDYHVYLSPIDLAELRELGIVPFTFDQHERDVVLIPAGCAYQILNMTPCVNVSLNFLAPQSLKRCSEADAHFRASSCSRDALQFGLLLIHSWMSLSVAESQLGDEPPTIAPNKCPDPDFKLAPAKFKTETLLRELATSTAADAEALDPDEDTMEIDAACTSSPTPGSITRSSATPAHPVSATDPEFKVAVKHALYQLGIPIPGLVQRLPQYPSPEHYIPYSYLHPFNFHYPSNMASLGYALPTPAARPLPHQLAMPLPIPMPYSGSIGTGNGPSIHTWDSSIPITQQDPKVEQSSTTRSLALDPSGSTSIFRIKTFDRIQRRQRRCYNCARPYPECQGSRKRDESLFLDYDRMHLPSSYHLSILAGFPDVVQDAPDPHFRQIIERPGIQVVYSPATRANVILVIYTRRKPQTRNTAYLTGDVRLQDGVDTNGVSLSALSEIEEHSRGKYRMQS